MTNYGARRQMGTLDRPHIPTQLKPRSKRYSYRRVFTRRIIFFLYRRVFTVLIIFTPTDICRYTEIDWERETNHPCHPCSTCTSIYILLFVSSSPHLLLSLLSLAYLFSLLFTLPPIHRFRRDVVEWPISCLSWEGPVPAERRWTSPHFAFCCRAYAYNVKRDITRRCVQARVRKRTSGKSEGAQAIKSGRETAQKMCENELQRETQRFIESE